MIIAHAPSGYVMAVSLIRRICNGSVSAKAIIAVGIAGAFAPDLDMLYFHLIDNRQTHHHKYPTHWPIIWLALVATSALWFRLLPQSKAAVLSLMFCMGGVLHVLLDSFVGDVWWFAPFIDQPYAMFTVPARFNPWWLSFILHWSFLVEIAICVWALLLYRRGSRPSLQTRRV